MTERSLSRLVTDEVKVEVSGYLVASTRTLYSVKSKGRHGLSCALKNCPLFVFSGAVVSKKSQ